MQTGKLKNGLISQNQTTISAEYSICVTYSMTNIKIYALLIIQVLTNKY